MADDIVFLKVTNGSIWYWPEQAILLHAFLWSNKYLIIETLFGLMG